jgi:hypothetical protein
VIEYFILVTIAILALLVIRRHYHRRAERDRDDMRRHVALH